MSRLGRDELVLIRHLPADHGGRLCGRTDVPLRPVPPGATDGLRRWLEGAAAVASPARRCCETAALLFPGAPVPTDPRLWEQDFGVREGVAFDALPDLGAMPLEALAAEQPPGGESFEDMAARAAPALREAMARVRDAGPQAVVAHAGTVRAALGLALGAAWRGLAFEVAPLSLTRLRCLPGGLSVIAANVVFEAA